MSIVVSEDCPSSKNEFGTHCDHWYDDEGCHWCGTEEPNLIIIEVPEQGGGTAQRRRQPVPRPLRVPRSSVVQGDRTVVSGVRGRPRKSPGGR